MPYKDTRDRKDYHKRVRQRNKAFIKEYLQYHPCVDCWIDDIRVLEFDHIDSNLKVKGIAEMLYGTYSLKTIQEEIGKCEVRCANCHRIKTYIDFGHMK